MKYLGEQSRRYVFSVRKKHNIDPNCREFLNQFIVHVAALPIRPVEQCIKMVFFPCLHFIHTCLWNCEIHTFKFSDDCNSLFKGYNGSFVFTMKQYQLGKAIKPYRSTLPKNITKCLEDLHFKKYFEANDKLAEKQRKLIEERVEKAQKHK